MNIKNLKLSNLSYLRKRVITDYLHNHNQLMTFFRDIRDILKPLVMFAVHKSDLEIWAAQPAHSSYLYLESCLESSSCMLYVAS